MRLFNFIIIMALVLSGCVKPRSQDETQDIMGDVVLSELEHKGHIYLVFVYDRTKSCAIQVIHSPDCKGMHSRGIKYGE